MPRQGQIIPKYLVPHVETYINDNSTFTDSTSSTSAEDGLRLLCIFASPKGRDRELLTFSNTTDFINEYGTPNFSLYGQPMLNAWAALNSGNAICHCMRVAPSDANYANVVVLAKVKVDNGEKKVTVKFDTKIIQNLADGDALSLLAEAETDTSQDEKVYPILAVRSCGRGAYGNSIRFRLSTDTMSDSDNDFKNYNFSLMSTSTKTDENFSISLDSDAIIDKESIFIEDVVNDGTYGSTKVSVAVIEENLKAIYDLYTAQFDDPSDATVSYSEFDFLNGLVKGTLDEKIAHYEVDLENGIGLDKQDGIFLAGGTEGAFEGNPPTEKSEVDNLAALYKLTTADTDIDDIIKVKDQNEYYRLIDGVNIGNENGWELVQWGRQHAMDKEYLSAFRCIDGYSTAVKSKRRSPVEMCLDANYSNDVKIAMVGLFAAGNKSAKSDPIQYSINPRKDAMVILDATTSCDTVTQVEAWNDTIGPICSASNDVGIFIVKECQKYTIRDPFTSKKIEVTSTYFYAQNYPTHYMTYGPQVPFVGSIYAELSGHVKNSLRPIIDADDLETKESLYVNRINFFECIGENQFIRATQGTAQNQWSDLSEQNNMMVTLEMKRKLEDLVSRSLYNFAESSDRTSFTKSADDMFADYKNSRVRDYSVYFDMNSYEEQRSILHCYLDIQFRTMAKRGIIEIDISKRA